jgi:dihydrofolate reductase
VRALVDDADRDVSVGGATLAATALRAGIVDELHQLLHPVVVGGGTPYLPAGVRLDLELLDERRFAGGVVHLHHRVVR